MNPDMAKISYLNTMKKIANKTNSVPEKKVLKGLLNRSNSDKIESKEDNDIAVQLVERVLKGFNKNV